MSYSIVVKAATKADARSAVEATFNDEVVSCQPAHARDKAAMLANVDAALGLLGDDATKDVEVCVTGYLTWNGDDQLTGPLSTVGITCNVSIANRG